MEDYTSKVNKYESAEKATEKFEADHKAWEDGKPAKEDYVNEELYNEALEDYLEINPEPTIDNGNYELGDYATEEEAQEAYSEAYDEYYRENPYPYEEAEKFIQETDYESDYVDWEESKPDLEEFEILDENENNYDEALEAWDEEEPYYEEYLGETDYAEDYSDWLKEEPSLSDHVVK